MNKDRIEYIDIAKGIGMLAVIFGHIMLSGNGFVLAYAFDMPLFIFLSGLVFNKEKYPKFKTFVISRSKSLLLPYVIFSVVTWALWAALSYVTHKDVISYFNPLLQTVIAQGSGQYFVHNYPLWFPTFLFLLEIIYYFVCKTPKIINTIICILLAVVGFFMIQPNDFFDFTLLPWSIEAVLRAIIFYALGNMFTSKFGTQKISAFINGKKVIAFIVWITSTALFVICAIYNGAVSIGSNIYGKSNILFYIVSVFGIISAILCSAFLEYINKRHSFKALSFIKWIGRNSFFFMAIHKPVSGIVNLVLVFMESRFNLHFLSNISYNYIPSIISWVLSVIGTSISVLVLNFLLNNIKKLNKQKT